MKSRLSSCTLIALISIVGLTVAVSTHTAAATYCHWDTITKQNVCVDNYGQFNELSQQSTLRPYGGVSAEMQPYPEQYSYDDNYNQLYFYAYDQSHYSYYKQGYFYTLGQSYHDGYDSSYYNPYSYTSYGFGPGYHYFGSIYTWLCGWQYNTWVSFDYDCANDIPAWWP